MSRQLFSCLSCITMSGLLVFISLFVCIGISHNIVMLSLSVTVWGSCSYYFSPTFIFSSLQMFQCRYEAALSCLCRYSVLASSGHPTTIWSMVSTKNNITFCRKQLPWQQQEPKRLKERHGNGGIKGQFRNILLDRMQDSKLCNINLETLSKWRIRFITMWWTRIFSANVVKLDIA